MFFVYILQSKKDEDLYIGFTDNLVRRLKEHNTGKTISTKFRKPFILVYYEVYRAESDARRRETNLKLRGQARAHLKKRLSASLALNTN